MLQICANIKLAREAAGKTQQEMADLLEVKRTTYANWEKETEPSLTILKSIASILSIDFSELIDTGITPAAKREEIAALNAAVRFLISEIKVLKAKVYNLSHSKVSLEVDTDLKQWTKQLVDEVKNAS